MCRAVLHLRRDTPQEWVETVRADFDAFLRDHAANERKAAASAMLLVTHHYDCAPLVDAMIELAQEEMEHFRLVYALLRSRGAGLGQDAPDPYMTQLHRAMRKEEKFDYLLDRLLVSSIIEARGCERFGILGDALEPGPLQTFYRDLTRAEARHRGLFLRLANQLFEETLVAQRLGLFLDTEAEIVAALPLRAAMH